MKIHILLLLTLFMHQMDANAQLFLFHPKDSVRQNKIIQLGIGGNLGTQLVIPDKEYQIVNNMFGFNNGAFIRANIHLTNHLSVLTDIRYDRASLGLSSFYMYLVKSTNFKVPVLVKYAIRNRESNELISVLAGVSFNHTKYSVLSQELDYSLVTVSELTFVSTQTTKNYMSGVLGISKQFELTNIFYLQIFNEYELPLSNSWIYNINDPVYHNEINYNPFHVRLGICLMY